MRPRTNYQPAARAAYGLPVLEPNAGRVEWTVPKQQTSIAASFTRGWLQSEVPRGTGGSQQRFSAMLAQRTVSTVLWLSGAGGAFALGCLLLIVADDGNIHAAALIAFFWTAALLAGAIHHSVGRADTSPRHHRQPLAGPRQGASLPG
jgi:hypothetical protein